MPDPIRYEDDDLFNPETQHEHTDVPVRPLWWAMIIFVVFAIVSHILLWFMYKAFVAGERNRAEEPQTQVQRPAGADVPQDQPLLQPFPKTREGSDDVVSPTRNTPRSDLADVRRAEDAVLNSYGWVNQEQGIVHIPIDVAKDLAAARMAIQEQTGGIATTAAVRRAPAAAPAVSATSTAVPPATPTGANQ